MCPLLCDNLRVGKPQQKQQNNMSIENIIKITEYSTFYNAHMESTIWLNRPRRLTLAGAQRIIRQERPQANAVSIQYMYRE